MVDTNSTDPLAPQYEDPSTLERQAPPPVVTYKKEEEAATVQPAPAASVRGRGVRDGYITFIELFRKSGGWGAECQTVLDFGVSELNVERCVLDQAGIVVGWNLSGIVVVGGAVR